MSALDVDSARGNSHILFAIICVLMVCSLSSTATAQCTDPVPTEPVEEQVENTIFGSLGCVAMHEEGDFIIAWRQRIDGFRSTIRVQRFCRDGSLLESYATLSGPSDSTWMPSIAAGCPIPCASRDGGTKYGVEVLTPRCNLALMAVRLFPIFLDRFPDVR